MSLLLKWQSNLVKRGVGVSQQQYRRWRQHWLCCSLFNQRSRYIHRIDCSEEIRSASHTSKIIVGSLENLECESPSSTVLDHPLGRLLQEPELAHYIPDCGTTGQMELLASSME